MPDIRPNNHEIDLIVKDVRTKSLPNESTSLTMPLFPITQATSKPRFDEYSQDTQDMAYTTLSSGEQVAKYENYLPGTNNEERFAQKQTTSEKWVNGTAKLFGKTGVAVLGGTLGVVDSLVEGIAKGSLSEAYNTNFNNWLDDLNVQLDYKLPNYYTEQEKNASLFGQTTQANFWADKVFGGLSFTAGALISEGIWTAATGGVGLLAAESQLAKLAKWTVKGVGGEAKTMKALNLAKTTSRGSADMLLDETAISNANKFISTITDATKSSAINTYKLKKVADIALVATRSAGYESGMEARQYMNSTEHAWLENYQKVNGAEPSAEEYSKFKDGLTTSANAVFGANMIIVGGSNIAQFGNALLGKTTNPLMGNNLLKRSLLGIGFDKTVSAEGKVLYKALEATKAQKVAGKVWGVLGAAIPESQEEMGQRVVSQTAENYMLNAFSSEKTKTTYGVADAFTSALNSTYGTKEGWSEGLIGGIVGILGAGAHSRFKFGDVTAEREDIQRNVDYVNAFTADNHLNNVIANNKILKSQENKEIASQRGDLVGEILADAESAIAFHERNVAIGNTQEGVNDFARQINAVSDEELAKELGFGTGEEAEKQASQFKEQKIVEFKNLSEKHEKNLNYAQALLGEIQIAGLDKISTREVVRAMAYSMTMGETAMKTNQDLVSHVKSLVSESVNLDGITDALDVQQILDLAPKEKTLKLSQLNLQLFNLNKKEKELLNRQFEASKVSESTLATPEDSKARQNGLIDINRELLELQEEKTTISQQKQLALDSIGIKNYTDATITVDMFENQNDNLVKLRATLKDIQLTNPEKFHEIKKALEAQSKAVEHIKNYQKTTRAVVDPNTRVKVLNGWVTNLLNKNTKLNEGTEAYFSDILEKWNTDTIVTFQENDNLRERKAFQNGEVVSEGYKQELGKQVRDGVQLTSLDQEIYDAFQKEIQDNAKVTIEDGTTVVEVGETNPLQKLKDKVKEIISSNDYLTQYFGADLAEQKRTKPSQTDIKEYEELLAKIDRRVEANTDRIVTRPTGFYKNLGLTNEEVDKLKEIQTRLNDWVTLEGSVSNDNQSAAEMLDLIDAMQTKQVATEVKTELKDKDYTTVIDAVNEEAGSAGNSVRGLQTPTNALVTIRSNNVRFSHIRVETLASFFPNSNLIVNSNKTFEIALNNGQLLSGKVNEKGGQDVTLKDWQAVQSQSTVLIKNFGTNSAAISQFLGLDSQGNELYQNVPSDFDYQQTDGVNLQIDTDAVNQVKNGDELDLFVSSTDQFNKGLNSKNLPNQIHIYVMKNGKLLGSLPAPHTDSEGNIKESAEGIGLPLVDLRRFAAEFSTGVGLKNLKGKETLIKLPQKMAAQMIFIGAPQITLQKDIENVSTKNNPFTKESLQNVVGQGFIENGKITSTIKIEVNQFINKISGANKDAKIPFVAFNYNGKVVAFPISLNSFTVDKSEGIFDNAETTSQKAKVLVETLIQNGLVPQSYGIDFTDKEGWLDSEETQKALADLSQIKEFIDVERFATKAYKKENLVADATIAIDISNSPFQTSKIMLAVSNKIDGDVLGYREFLEEQTKRANDVRAAITEVGLKIQKSIQEKTVNFSENQARRTREVVSKIGTTLEQLYFNYNKSKKLTNNFTEFLEKTPSKEGSYENVLKLRTLLSTLTATKKESIGGKLVEDARALIKELTQLENPNNVFIQANTLVSTLDERPIVEGTSYAVMQGNVNTLREAVKRATSETKKVIGEDLFEEANSLFLQLEYSEGRVREIEKQIKNSEFYQEVDPTFITVNEEGVIENPYINEVEVIQELGGYKTQEEFERALENSSLEYVKTANISFEELSQFNRIPAKEITDGELVDKLNTEVKDTLEATLRSPENNILESSLSSIEGYSASVWNSSPEAVKTLLREIEKQALSVNVDLRGLVETYDTKSQADILNVTRSLDFMLKNPSEVSMENFINVYQDFTNVAQEAVTIVTKVADKYRNLPLISLETQDSEYKVFQEQGLLKVQDGVCIKTDGNIRSLGEVEDLSATNLQVFPTNTVKASVKNVELVKEDLNTFVESKMADILTNDAEYDLDTLKKLIYYKTYFGTTNSEVGVDHSVQLSQLANVEIRNADYLTSEFIGDIRNKQLRGENPVLSNLTFNQKGITLKYTDIQSVKEMNDYLKEDLDLRNYFLLSKNTNFELTDVAQEELIFERDNLINGATKENYKGDYRQINENVIQVKTEQDFITIEGNNYERVSGEFFVKLNKNVSEFLTINSEKPMLDIDVVNYASVKNEAKIDLNNKYSKKEEKNIDDSLECA